MSCDLLGPRGNTRFTADCQEFGTVGAKDLLSLERLSLRVEWTWELTCAVTLTCGRHYVDNPRRSDGEDILEISER